MYPDDRALADAKENCEMMPFMVGCNILRACEAGDMDSDSRYCRPFDILATTCIDPGMSGMGGCSVYTPLCLTRGSVVRQCNQQQGVPRLVGTSQTQVRIRNTHVHSARTASFSPTIHMSHYLSASCLFCSSGGFCFASGWYWQGGHMLA